MVVVMTKFNSDGGGIIIGPAAIPLVRYGVVDGFAQHRFYRSEFYDILDDEFTFNNPSGSINTYSTIEVWTNDPTEFCARDLCNATLTFRFTTQLAGQQMPFAANSNPDREILAFGSRFPTARLWFGRIPANQLTDIADSFMLGDDGSFWAHRKDFGSLVTSAVFCGPLGVNGQVGCGEVVP